MTHNIKGTPTMTNQTVYHDGDDIVFYPMPGGLRITKDEAYRLGCYLKGEPVQDATSIKERIDASEAALAHGPVDLT